MWITVPGLMCLEILTLILSLWFVLKIECDGDVTLGKYRLCSSSHKAFVSFYVFDEAKHEIGAKTFLLTSVLCEREAILSHKTSKKS